MNSAIIVIEITPMLFAVTEALVITQPQRIYYDIDMEFSPSFEQAADIAANRKINGIVGRLMYISNGEWLYPSSEGPIDIFEKIDRIIDGASGYSGESGINGISGDSGIEG